MSVRESDFGGKIADERPARSRSRPVAWLLRSLQVGAVSLGLTILSIGAYSGVVIYQGNFHAVSAGVLYRSAQVDKADLEWAAREHGVKSVLNLRGANPGAPWYDEEVAAARNLGLAHFDYGISAHRVVTGKQIAEILDIVRHAPKPLLVHCKSGSDRTGLVAALYRYALGSASPEEADQELSLLYGHFPYLTSRSVAMDDSFWAFVRETPARRP
jgi:protein tyrosine phosphatase (PTP) superfamily phosphohydrolase (DUF442 family)